MPYVVIRGVHGCSNLTVDILGGVLTRFHLNCDSILPCEAFVHSGLRAIAIRHRYSSFEFYKVAVHYSIFDLFFLSGREHF